MKSKTLTDQRVIAGLFREALFQSRKIRVKTSSLDAEALITDLIEANTRDKEIERKVGITFRTSQSMTEIPDAELTVAFPKFLLKLKQSLTKWPDGQYGFSIPSEVGLENNRSETRNQQFSLRGDSSPAYIRSQGLHIEGRFEIEDYSSSGYGGILKLSPLFPLQTGSTIKCEIHNKSGSLKVDGKIVRWEIVEEPESVNQDRSYRIGIESVKSLSSNSKSEPTPEIPERRRHKRLQTELTITLTSPINPSYPIDLKTENSSIVGFAGRIKDASLRTLLPAGISVQLFDKTLRAELVSTFDDLFRFEIIEGTNDDRLWWLKKLTLDTHDSVSVGSTEGEEIMRLFCEAGAVATPYLQIQKRFADHYESDFTGSTLDEPWIHKWIERTPDGEIKGHISAVKFGDNSWFIGDIAGSTVTERKISSNFIPSFFSNFLDVTNQMSPSPRLMITWSENHPYWAEYQKNLLEKYNSSNNQMITRICSYVRKQNFNPSPNNSLDLVKVRASDHSLIEDLRCTFSKKYRGLLDAFDFNPNTFASPNTRAAITNVAKNWRREYFYFKASLPAILVTTQFEKEISPNSNHKACWLVIEPESINELQIQDLIHTVFHLLIDKDAHFPGVIITSNLDEISPDYGYRKMFLLCGNTESFQCFRGKNK